MNAAEHDAPVRKITISLHAPLYDGCVAQKDGAYICSTLAKEPHEANILTFTSTENGIIRSATAMPLRSEIHSSLDAAVTAIRAEGIDGLWTRYLVGMCRQEERQYAATRPILPFLQQKPALQWEVLFYTLDGGTRDRLAMQTSDNTLFPK